MNRAKKKVNQPVLTPQDLVNNCIQKAAEVLPAPEPVVVEVPVVHEPVKPSCAKCRWSDAARTESNTEVNASAFGMVCRVGPPAFVGLNFTQQTKIRSLGQFAFPRVREDDWCGQFEPKE